MSEMPAANVFIDSITFLYTLDRNEPAKGQIALDWPVELRRAGTGVTNLQALNEVVSVATRKAGRFLQRRLRGCGRLRHVRHVAPDA